MANPRRKPGEIIKQLNSGIFTAEEFVGLLMEAGALNQFMRAQWLMTTEDMHTADTFLDEVREIGIETMRYWSGGY
jgi:hypothetical protein